MHIVTVSIEFQYAQLMQRWECALQLVAVLDADMVISADFFLKTLPYLQADTDALVLTPQAFHNFNPRADVFGHANCIFWDVIVPGCVDGYGGIMCTGTSYCVRSKALQVRPLH